MIAFTPSDEQQLIIETVRRYATERLRPAAHDADEQRETPADIISQVPSPRNTAALEKHTRR
jgi:acyl-CoA dehydrogenase